METDCNSSICYRLRQNKTNKKNRIEIGARLKKLFGENPNSHLSDLLNRADLTPFQRDVTAWIGHIEKKA